MQENKPECQGCDVPKGGVYRISEPSRDKEQLLLVLGEENNQLRARNEQLEAQLAAVQQGVQPEVDLPDVEDMAHSALEECLSGGLSHFVLHKWMRSVMTKTQKALATHPTQQGLDAKDAARWREALQHVGADNILGGAQYVFRGRAPVNVMRGSVAEHFTKTIDAALEAQAKQGEQA